VFHAFDSWLGTMGSQQRVLLVLDDLHWADPPSLRLLEYLLRSSHNRPLLIIATCRHSDSDSSGWLSESLAGLRRAVAVEHLSLQGLSEGEAAELLSSVLGRPLSEGERLGAGNLHRHTQGNPFFLQAVGRDLLAEAGSLQAWGDLGEERLPLPQHLRDVVRWRLRQLSRPCMDVLAAGSVMGLTFSSLPVGDAVGCTDDALMGALDEARRAGVVADGPSGSDQVRFSHAVVRRTLYEDLGELRRTRLHHRIAQALDARRGSSPVLAEELAHHYFLGAGAGGLDEALTYARLAAADASARFAYEPAVVQLERALELVATRRPGESVERCRLLLDCAAVTLKAGDRTRADERYLEAFETARATGRADLAADAALGFGGVLPAGALPDDRARSLLETSLADLGADDRRRSLVLGRLSQWGHFDRPIAERQALSDEAVALAHQAEDPTTLAEVLGYRFWALTGPDDCDRRLRSAAEMRSLGERLGDPETVLQSFKCELHVRFELADYEGSVRAAEVVRDLASVVRQPEYLRLVSMWDSLVAGMEGRYADAEASATEAVQIFRRTDHPQIDSIYVGLSVPWRWLQGSLVDLWPLLGDAAETWERTYEHAFLAWLASASGEHEKARRLLAAVTRRVTCDDHNFQWWFLAVGMAQAAINLEDRDAARQAYALIEPYATHNARVGGATFLGAATLHLGWLALFLGRHEDAVAQLEEALGRHRAMGARPFEAVNERLLAAALRARGRAEDATRADRLEATGDLAAAELGLAPTAVPAPTQL
jgi:tetratricopeptide (TPR) repeat protein